MIDNTAGNPGSTANSQDKPERNHQGTAAPQTENSLSTRKNNALEVIRQEMTDGNPRLDAAIDELRQAYADLENLMESAETGTMFFDRDMNVKRFTPLATELFELSPADIGRPLGAINHRILPTDEDWCAIVSSVLERKARVERTIKSIDGAWYVLRVLPYLVAGNECDGIVLTFHNVTRLKETEEVLRRRNRQQQAVAQLGQLALHEKSIDVLLSDAVRRVAETLDVPFCKILELLPDRARFIMRAGIGWGSGVVGVAQVDADVGTQAGYTLLSTRSVIVENWQHETRFTPAQMLIDHDVISGISVVISGVREPFGILSAHSQQPRAFTEDDVSFFESVAHLLAGAIERTRSEDALRESQHAVQRQLAEIEAIYGSAPVGLFVVDTDLRIVRINQRMAAINGKPVSAHLGKHVEDVGSELYLTLLPVLRRMIETGAPQVQVELKGHMVGDPDKERSWLASLYPVKRDESTLSGAGCVLLDISDRKEHDDFLLYQAQLLDTVPDAVISVDADFRIVSWNRAAENIYGWRADEVVGRLISDVLKTEYSDPTQSRDAAIETLVETARWQGEVIQYTKSGQPLTIRNGTALLFDSSGNRRGAVAVNRDVSSYKQTETTLRNTERELRALAATLEERVAERTAELAHTVESLDQFTHIASHDLRSPLRAIDNLAAWLVEDVGNQLPARSQEHLTRMRNRIWRMERLLDSLLEYSRAGRNDQRPVELNLSETVENIVATLGTADGFAVTVHGPTTVVAPRTAFELVLRNLIDNAVKHHRTPTGNIEVCAVEMDGAVELSVTDDGPGIDPQFHTRIFGAFQTLRPRDEVEGSGMGLTLVKRIVESWGGRVTVESTPGAGATFRFTVPNEPASPPTSSGRPDADVPVAGIPTREKTDGDDRANTT